MRKRYKIVLNLELDDPDESYPAGGDYTHLSRLQRVIHGIVSSFWGIGHTKTTVTLDKVIDKGEITESAEPTCKVLVDGKACGEPALFRAGVPTASGDFTIPVCEAHCPGIITSIVGSK
jgi:hypothetical protein